MYRPSRPADHCATSIPTDAQVIDDNHLWSLDERAEMSPDAIALDYHGHHLTYRALADASLTLAGYMQQHLGVRSGDRVLVLMKPCPQFLIACHATRHCGAEVVAVDPESCAAEVAASVADSGACAAVTMQDGISRVAPLLSGDGLRGCIVGAYSEFAGEPGTPPWLAAPEHVRDPRVPLLQPRVHEFSGALAAGIAPASAPRAARH